MLQCYILLSAMPPRGSRCRTRHTPISLLLAVASYWCGEHQIERGLHGCLPSIAGRSCSSLLPLRQARICRRISWGLWGFSITLQRYEKTMTYARKVTTIFHIIWTYLDTSGQKWTTAPATVVTLHRQSGTTSRRGKIYSSAEEDFPLGGAVKDPPSPFRGRD